MNRPKKSDQRKPETPEDKKYSHSPSVESLRPAELIIHWKKLRRPEDFVLLLKLPTLDHFLGDFMPASGAWWNLSCFEGFRCKFSFSGDIELIELSDLSDGGGCLPVWKS